MNDKELSSEFKRLLELAQLVGESQFIEDKLAHILRHLDDAEELLDTDMRKAEDGDSIYISRTMGRLWRGLRETRRVYSARNREILDALGSTGFQPHDFTDSAVRQMLGLVEGYSQEAASEALAQYNQPERQPKRKPRGTKSQRVLRYVGIYCKTDGRGPTIKEMLSDARTGLKESQLRTVVNGLVDYGSLAKVPYREGRSSNFRYPLAR